MKLMVIGFPKSGTTTITRAVEASGFKAAHWQDPRGRYFGALIYHAGLNGLDPFAHMQGYDAVTQADVCMPGRGINFWPNLDFALLRTIRRAHPECLFVLNYRRPEAIADSIAKWPGMQNRFEHASIPGLPRGYGGTREQLITWIENHFDACRTYFRHDQHFVEIDIEDPEAPNVLGARLGVPIVEWGDFKPSKDNPARWTRHA
jgi:hypothetical protein